MGALMASPVKIPAPMVAEMRANWVGVSAGDTQEAPETAHLVNLSVF